MAQAQSGTIKNLKESFGFIRGDADGVERFFHASGVRGGKEKFLALRIGQQVRFVDDAPGQKGPRATDVDPL